MSPLPGGIRPACSRVWRLLSHTRRVRVPAMASSSRRHGRPQGNSFGAPSGVNEPASRNIVPSASQMIRWLPDFGGRARRNFAPAMISPIAALSFSSAPGAARLSVSIVSTPSGISTHAPRTFRAIASACSVVVACARSGAIVFAPALVPHHLSSLQREQGETGRRQ